MPATSHLEFDANTEALEVAQAFSSSIHGKTVLVTGVNPAGIGFATAEAFASQSPSHLIIAGRSTSKIQDSIDKLKSKFPSVDYRPLQIDLSSQQSVRTAAAKLLSWSDIPSVNLIINSAGVMLVPERTITADGIELTFATNHIGHFLLTCLIMPKLIKASEESPKGSTRIINVSSGSPIMARMRWSDMNFEKKSKDLPEVERPSYSLLERWGVKDPENKTYIPLEGYNVSKISNVLFSVAINDRLYDKYGILSLALHPGVIRTELGRNATPETLAAVKSMMDDRLFSYRSLGAGASTSMVAALDPKLGVGETKDGKENYGVFLSDCQINDQAQPLAVSSKEAEKLWELSEELVKQKFDW